MELTGNTVVITGGTSGIGRALAEALHAKGNKVIVAGRRRHLLEEMEKANPGMVGMQVDLQDSRSIDEFTAKVRKHFPQVNVLVNNAGIQRPEDFAHASGDADLAATIINANITSVIRVTAGLLPTLKAQPKATLIATTSGLAFVPMAKTPTYNGTKAFLHSWLDSMRYQLRKTSVEVLELAPPYVQTELAGPEQKVDPRAMPLSDYISEVLHLLEIGDLPKGEILVERVKPLRWAEKEGKYDAVMEMLASL